jgi:hypothetical protein
MDLARHRKMWFVSIGTPVGAVMGVAACWLLVASPTPQARPAPASGGLNASGRAICSKSSQPLSPPMANASANLLPCYKVNLPLPKPNFVSP